MSDENTEKTYPDLSKGEENNGIVGTNDASTGSATEESTGSATQESTSSATEGGSNTETEEEDTTTVAEAEEKLKVLDIETNSPDYQTMKKLVKELNIEVPDMKAATLLDALTAKKAELIGTPPQPSPEMGGSNTVENAELRVKMQSYFDYNPHVDLFYITSDGMPFYDKQDAIRQQKIIAPKTEILIINR